MNNILQSINTLLFGLIAALLLVQYQTPSLSVEASSPPPHEFPSPAALANDISAKVVDQLKDTSALKESNIRLIRLEARTEQIERSLGLTNRWGTAQ